MARTCLNNQHHHTNSPDRTAFGRHSYPAGWKAFLGLTRGPLMSHTIFQIGKQWSCGVNQEVFTHDPGESLFLEERQKLLDETNPRMTFIGATRNKHVIGQRLKLHLSPQINELSFAIL